MADICFFPSEQDKQGQTDFRYIFLEMEFHQIPFSDLLNAAIAFVRAINDFQGNQFVMDWYVNNRKASQKTIEKAILTCRDKVMIAANGIVKNSRVFNHATFRRYIQSLDFNPEAHGYSSCSEDYPDYFQNEVVPFFDDEKLLKEAILKLFQLEGKKPLGFRDIYDSGCLFVGGKHDKLTPERFWGKAIFCVSVAACEGFLDPVSEQLESILFLLADILKNTNGRIGVCPYKDVNMSSYMTYFGEGYENVDGSHIEAGLSPQEWYPYYYVCGVEWMNYLSALPASRIPREQKNAPGVISFAQNAGLIVKSTDPISKIDVSALSEVKKVLSPVLYPGTYTIDLNKYYQKHLYSMLPRSNWEIVPITSVEVSVKGSTVTFGNISKSPENGSGGCL